MKLREPWPKALSVNFGKPLTRNDNLGLPKSRKLPIERVVGSNLGVKMLLMKLIFYCWLLLLGISVQLLILIIFFILKLRYSID